MTYDEFEEAVFERLTEWQNTQGWYFSMRLRPSKGAETDRFIGTRNYSYFGTTFWKIKSGYPGSANDPIDVWFVQRQNGFEYKIELKQTRHPSDQQNELVLELNDRLSTSTGELWERAKVNSSDRKIASTIIAGRKQLYDSLDELLDDLHADLELFIPHVDSMITQIKAAQPDFEAERLGPEDSKRFEDSYRRRRERYGTADEPEEAPAELSVQQWLRFLRDPEVFSSKELAIINAFYHSPGHTNTTTRIDSIVKQQPFDLGEPGPINIIVYYITQRIEHRLAEPFNYVMRENGKPVYYSMLFSGKRVESYWVWTMLPKLVEAYRRFGPAEAPDFNEVFESRVMTNFPLNQILYGPPGTGKTYATIEMAVRIANPDFTIFENREALHEEFRRLKDVRRIAFTTFHQSLSYEDFVEGLKPKLVEEENDGADQKQIEYEVKPGIFKDLVTFAKSAVPTEKNGANLALSPEQVKDAKYFKMSLGNSTNPADQEIYDYCIANNCIAMGYGQDIDFSGAKSDQDIKALVKHAADIAEDSKAYTIVAVKCLKNWMSEGDIVFVPNGSREIRAIGIVTGDYYFDPDTEIRFSQFRSVKWLQTDLNYPIKKIYGKQFSHMTTYQMYTEPMRQGLLEVIEERKGRMTNHVLIIDEINRGNVSAILGELITLLEPDKRLGAREELKVTLPYSREEFGVPPNLYLIGTMNTADRSVEALDAALRRRFTFREVAPDADVISRVHADAGLVSVGELTIDLAKLLTVLNRRIKALKDADHQIGHSYFLRVNDWQGLASAFNDRIIPLLREYFFANYGQLQLVVGKGFCAVDAAEKTTFAAADEEVEDYAGDYKSYRFPAPATEADLAAALRQLGLS